ncbi:MAG: HlyD family efflux transporter periplasmic adaptor subunit [Prolixibacteraceae bacterium]|nr:HlyD family efflux transporter periplasmic adaptor subunit [Prolixibacteraceae bacterium]
MSENNNIELRSDEVQEIMGTPPKWIIRRGITIILAVVIVLLVGSYFYKYPDLISARVTIVSGNPPISIVARSDGKLDKIFVADKQTVSANTILGIIENPANYEDVYQLIQFLDSIQGYFSSPVLFNNLSFNNKYSLGQVHSFYSSFISQLKDYQTFLNFNPYEQRVQSLEKQVVDYQNYFTKSRAQIAVLRQDYELAFSQFLRDSSLHAKKVMSDVVFEKSNASMLKQKYAYQNAMTNLASTQITMNQLKQQIQEQKVLKSETGNKLLATLKERYDNLATQLKAWEQAFVLQTPIAGRVTFTNYWSINQFVSAGNIVFTIVPSQEQEIIGKAVIPVAGAGKVETGQKVNIKLDNYPYMEFGILEGEITNISMVPVTTGQGGYYTAEIKLKKELVTNYKKELPFSQEMQGVAEIVTKDRRLIERLIEPLVSIFRERL